MFPIGDDNSQRRLTPYVTFVLIAINALVFLLETQYGNDFIEKWAFIPGRFTAAPSGEAVTILSAMFMHGGFMHIAGNMLYFWIFGDNVEDVLGHGRFLALYLLSGIAAAGAQTLAGPGSAVPMIGASGAISGVLGAYLILFPYARVLVLLVFGFFARLVYVPAVIVLGFWIVVQFVNGFVTIGAVATGGAETGGTAWFAHIGGFLAGIALLFLLRPRRSGRL